MSRNSLVAPSSPPQEPGWPLARQLVGCCLPPSLADSRGRSIVRGCASGFVRHVCQRHRTTNPVKRRHFIVVTSPDTLACHHLPRYNITGCCWSTPLMVLVNPPPFCCFLPWPLSLSLPPRHGCHAAGVETMDHSRGRGGVVAGGILRDVTRGGVRGCGLFSWDRVHITGGWKWAGGWEWAGKNSPRVDESHLLGYGFWVFGVAAGTKDARRQGRGFR